MMPMAPFKIECTHEAGISTDLERFCGAQPDPSDFMYLTITTKANKWYTQLRRAEVEAMFAIINGTLPAPVEFKA